MHLLLFIVLFYSDYSFSIDVFVRWSRLFFYLTSVFPIFRRTPLRTSHHCCEKKGLDFAFYSVLENVTLATNCWFVADVAAGMLVDKNRSVSLRWELNFFKFKFRLIFFIVLFTNMATLSRDCKPNFRPFPSCLKPQFQSEVKCEAIDMKMIFHSHVNKTRFRKKDSCT